MDAKREPVIVDAVRTPVGKRGGQLRDWHPTDLLAFTISHLVERTGVDPDRLGDVIAGCALQNGEQSGNIGRWAVIGAGLPEALPAVTIDRQCGSGQQAVHFAAQSVQSGGSDFAIACGIESMSRVDLGPAFTPGGGLPKWYGDQSKERYDGALVPQGPSAELVADKYGMKRETLDALSIESHRRASAATEAGYFEDQVIPVPIPDRGGTAVMTRDEGIRPSIDPERLATLRPVFKPDGVITAASASQISDGAAALLIADRAAAEAAGMRPRAAIRAMAVCGDDPILQFTAVVPAARKALALAGLEIGDMDRIEVNEAFACVPILFAEEMGIDHERLNVNGGSIAFGHPLGSTGARLMTALLYELERCDGRYGLLTICEAGGMANATIIERLD